MLWGYSMTKICRAWVWLGFLIVLDILIPWFALTHVEKVSGNVTIKVTLITLYHETAESITGIGTEGVNTLLWWRERWTYTNITSSNSSVVFTVTSRYSSAWYNYYNNTLSNANLVVGVDYNITQTSDSLRITINNVERLVLTHAFVYTYIGREAT